MRKTNIGFRITFCFCLLFLWFAHNIIPARGDELWTVVNLDESSVSSTVVPVPSSGGGYTYQHHYYSVYTEPFNLYDGDKIRVVATASTGVDRDIYLDNGEQSFRLGGFGDTVYECKDGEILTTGLAFSPNKTYRIKLSYRGLDNPMSTQTSMKYVTPQLLVFRHSSTPVFTSDLEEIKTYSYNSNLVLSVSANNVKTSNGYQWYKNGEPYSTSDSGELNLGIQNDLSLNGSTFYVVIESDTGLTAQSTSCILKANISTFTPKYSGNLTALPGSDLTVVI